MHTVRKRELDICTSILHGVDTFQFRSRNNGSADNLDRTRTSAVATSHLIVQLTDSSSELDVSELTVHVVSARSRRVSQPNAIVLDRTAVLLHNLYTVKDFTSGLLHLSELMHVIPELGLCDDRVWGKDDHSVSLWVGVLLIGGFSAHHLVLTHDSGDSHSKGVRKRSMVRE